MNRPERAEKRAEQFKKFQEIVQTVILYGIVLGGTAYVDKLNTVNYAAFHRKDQEMWWFLFCGCETGILNVATVVGLPLAIQSILKTVHRQSENKDAISHNLGQFLFHSNGSNSELKPITIGQQVTVNYDADKEHEVPLSITAHTLNPTTTHRIVVRLKSASSHIPVMFEWGYRIQNGIPIFDVSLMPHCFEEIKTKKKVVYYRYRKTPFIFSADFKSLYLWKNHKRHLFISFQDYKKVPFTLFEGFNKAQTSKPDNIVTLKQPENTPEIGNVLVNLQAEVLTAIDDAKKILGMLGDE